MSQVLKSTVDTESPTYRDNHRAMRARLAELATEQAKALAGGGPKYVQRHHDRGKLLARERIELLVDRDSAFLELSPLAAWGTDYPVGASVVTGIGVVAGVECVIVANDPTVRGGASNSWTLRKTLRANDIAVANRLPVVSLVESAGADLATQSEIFLPGGRLFRDLTRLSAAGIPTVTAVFGNATAGGAYVPGMSDYVIMVRDRAKVFLGGPPLVKMATGEEADDEELGGAEMHAGTSGLADHLAEDEVDALRLARRVVARLNWRKHGPAPAPSPAEPRYAAEELLGIVSADLRVPFDPREVIARIVDGSAFDEFKPRYGTSLVTGWAAVHGYPVGILANARGVLFSAESQKATQFIQLANAADTPLLFLQNTTGYMVGADYEQAGIIKHGAMMINAVANSRVPHLAVVMGASYGAGNYGMCGRAYDPRFLFSWPTAKSAVMGPAQLAGVLSIVARQAAAARGQDYDEDQDASMRRAVEEQVEAESLAPFLSGRLYDDGVIDPRDTRTVLGICLSAIHSGPVRGADGYGVFRM
jgi:acetyl-CoA carboxylase carboxyltransferase component